MKLLKRLQNLSSNEMLLVMFSLLLATISICVNFPMFGSWFGIIDDHIIVEQLRPNNPITIFNLPQRLLSDTEIGNFGNFPRFRPFYYLLKFLLISTFGDWTAGYYLFRTFLHTLCAILVFRIIFPSSQTDTEKSFLHQTFLASLAFLISASSLLVISWTDITLRLGPSEIELTFGVLLTAFACLQLMKISNVQVKSNKRYFLLLCLGVIFAVGAKENGLITLLPFTYLATTKFRTLIPKSKAISFVFGLALFQSVLVLINSFLVIVRGKDVYDNPRTIETIFDALIERITNSEFSILLISTGLLLSLLYQNQNKKFHILFLVVFFDLIYLSEGVFYAGSPPALRYLILSQICVLVVPFITITEYLRNLPSALTITRFKFFPIYLSIFLGMYFFLQPIKQYEIYRDSARANLDYTEIWRNELDKIKSSLGQYPDASVAIGITNSGYDYERTFSLIQFIRYQGFENPIFLRILFTETPVEDRLAEELKFLSDNGSTDWELTPINELNAEGDLFCFFFGIDINNINGSTKMFMNDRCHSNQILSS